MQSRGERFGDGEARVSAVIAKAQDVISGKPVRFVVAIIAPSSIAVRFHPCGPSDGAISAVSRSLEGGKI
jgi:hypothetical protein